jgi:hypothetical protein
VQTGPTPSEYKGELYRLDHTHQLIALTRNIGELPCPEITFPQNDFLQTIGGNVKIVSGNGSMKSDL